jgi:hypothetical protein
MEAKFCFEAVIYNPEGKIREAKSREAATAETPTTAGKQQEH